MKLYSPQFMETLRSTYSNPNLQEIIHRDLNFQVQITKKFKSLKASYSKELVLLLHRQLISRYVVCQFVKRDLFNNLFWIVLVSVSGVLNKTFDVPDEKQGKLSLSKALDITFVIKIFNNKYQKLHVNQETLGSLKFEKQLQMKIKVKKIIKGLLIAGKIANPVKKILCENLSRDLTIVDSKIKLKHRGETSAINEQEFFQQNVEKKISSLTKNTMMFTKRKAAVNDPVDGLFENSFSEIYNKVF